MQDAFMSSNTGRWLALAFDTYTAPSWIDVGIALWLAYCIFRSGWVAVRQSGRVVYMAWPFRETPIDPERPAAHVMVALDGEVKQDRIYENVKVVICPGVCRIVGPNDAESMCVMVDEERLHLMPHERTQISRRATERLDELQEADLKENTRRRKEADKQAKEEQATRDQLAAEELRRRLTQPRRMPSADTGEFPAVPAAKQVECPGCGGISGFHQSGCQHDPAKPERSRDRPLRGGNNNEPLPARR